MAMKMEGAKGEEVEVGVAAPPLDLPPVQEVHLLHQRGHRAQAAQEPQLEPSLPGWTPAPCCAAGPGHTGGAAHTKRVRGRGTGQGNNSEERACRQALAAETKGVGRGAGEVWV